MSELQTLSDMVQVYTASFDHSQSVSQACCLQ
jgi:hypothetical protein